MVFVLNFLIQGLNHKTFVLRIFQGFTYCLIFNFQGSLLFCCCLCFSATRYILSRLAVFVNSFFYFFKFLFWKKFEVFAASSAASYILSYPCRFVNTFFQLFSIFLNFPFFPNFCFCYWYLHHLPTPNYKGEYILDYRLNIVRLIPF